MLLDEDDPTASLHAWIGASFVGGWAGDDLRALGAAILGSLRAAGSLGSLGAIRIERAVSDIVHGQRFYESARDTQTVRDHAFALLKANAAEVRPAKTSVSAKEPAWWTHLWTAHPDARKPPYAGS